MSARYPNAPGFKVSGPSQDAAEKVQTKTERLRAAILEALATSPMTADEMADHLGHSVLLVRPRFSELKRVGRIEESSARRRNQSGMTATVWKVKVERWRQLSFLESSPPLAPD